MIEVKNLWRTFSGKTLSIDALKNISLNIKKGEYVGIMGRSGSGKSTLLHQLGLLDTPTKGEIFLNDQNILKFNSIERSQFRLNYLGYVFQEYALLPELTALEAVALPLMMLGISKKESLDRAMENLALVEMENRAHHLSHELSGGQQQRIAIARAIVNKPMILFADEPCANLDSESSKLIVHLFRKLNQEIGQTVVMVSHEPEDRKEVDRVIWMKDGVIGDDEK